MVSRLVTGGRGSRKLVEEETRKKEGREEVMRRN